MNPNRTLLVLKPDGYKRNLLITVLKELEHCVRVVRIETRSLTDGDVFQLYGRYEGESFYEALRVFMVSGPSVLMELVGCHAVSRVREIVIDIRENYASKTIARRNVVHCSDCAENAATELAYFLPNV